jgi:hypothetical protein
MRILNLILSLFGISTRKEANELGLTKEMKEEIERSIEAFKNRPIYKILTEEIINSTSDDNLLQVVFDNLSEKLPDDFEKEYQTVISWNKSRQAVYMIWVLDAEVNNGGFNQYYFNSSGKFYKHLPEALRLVGARPYAELVEKANQTFENEKGKITRHQDGTIEGFSKSYEDNPLNNFDNEFGNLYETEDLNQILIPFIRNNIPEFTDS